MTKVKTSCLIPAVVSGAALWGVIAGMVIGSKALITASIVIFGLGLKWPEIRALFV